MIEQNILVDICRKGHLAGNANKAAALLRNVGKSYPEPVAYATDLTSRILSQSETPVKRGESFSAGEVVQETGADPIETMPSILRWTMEYLGAKKEAAQLINAQGPDATPESGSVVASAKSVSQGYSGVKRFVSGTQETRGPADIVDNLPKEATV